MQSASEQVFHKIIQQSNAKPKKMLITFNMQEKTTPTVLKYINDTLPRGSTILNSLSRIDNALLYCLN